MFPDCCDEMLSVAEYYINKLFHALMQESLVMLIILGVMLTLSPRDNCSRFFVILSAIGVYSIYGSLAVRINTRRIEQAQKYLQEIKTRQYKLSLDTRRGENPVCTIFIPEKERAEENPFGRASLFTNRKFCF